MPAALAVPEEGEADLKELLPLAGTLGKPVLRAMMARMVLWGK